MGIINLAHLHRRRSYRCTNPHDLLFNRLTTDWTWRSSIRELFSWVHCPYPTAHVSRFSYSACACRCRISHWVLMCATCTVLLRVFRYYSRKSRLSIHHRVGRMPAFLSHFVEIQTVNTVSWNGFAQTIAGHRSLSLTLPYPFPPPPPGVLMLSENTRNERYHPDSKVYSPNLISKKTQATMFGT